MFKKKILLTSYPLVYLGLFAFTSYLGKLQIQELQDSSFVKSLIIVGLILLYVAMNFFHTNCYLYWSLNLFSELTQERCKDYFIYLDITSLILFTVLGVSFFFGASVYIVVSEILLYIALGHYLSSSAVILFLYLR